MKKIFIVVVAVLILIVAFFFFGSDKRVVGDTLLVSTFTTNGEGTGKVLIQVPFIQSQSERVQLSIAIDTNSDGSFSDDEYLISDFSAQPQKDWRSGYYAISLIPITDGMNARVKIDGTNYDAVVNTKTIEVGELLGLNSVTDPENAMKGWGSKMLYAQGNNDVSISQSGVPDLTQRPEECAPTSAANSLISLVDKFGGEDLISGDPQDFIENLKRHMNWTPENGVLPDDFVAGKNRWAAAAGVPIRTTKAGDKNGITTIDAIRDALSQDNSAVELRIAFADATLKFVSGHMVTVTGIHQSNGQTFLEINDPATPDSGTEQIKIENNEVVDYGPWSGITVLSWTFVQTWEGHPTGELLDTMTDTEIQGIEQFVGDTPTLMVIEHQGHHIPVSQLRVGGAHPPHATGEGCPEDHWHADGPVESVEKKTFNDPNSGGCGFGTLSQKPSQSYTLPPTE